MRRGTKLAEKDKNTHKKKTLNQDKNMARENHNTPHNIYTKIKIWEKGSKLAWNMKLKGFDGKEKKHKSRNTIQIGAKKPT